jgi:hypothetical protein
MSKQTKKKRKKKSVLLSVAEPRAVNVEQGEEDAKEGDEPVSAEASARRLDPFATGSHRWVCA